MVIAMCDYSLRRVGLQLLTDSRTVNKNVTLAVRASACRRQDAWRVRNMVQHRWCWSPKGQNHDYPGWFNPRGWQWVTVRYSENRPRRAGKGRGRK